MRESERVELEGVRAFAAAAPPSARVATAEVGGVLAVRCGAWGEAKEVNRILGLSTLEQLDELEPFYGGARFWISVDPATGLAGALEARGLRPDYPWQKFERGTEPLAGRTELSVRKADEPEHFGRVFAAGYGMPEPGAEWAAGVVGTVGWSCFVAYDGAEPVASGALFASGRTGWLGFAATVPAARGRGAQTAILSARIDRARELGLTLLVTETGVPRPEGPGPSYRNILRAGFRETYVRPNFVRSSAAGTH